MENIHNKIERFGFSVSDIVSHLSKFVFFERSIAHIISGWIPKIPELEIKTVIGQHLYQDMFHANLLRNRLFALTKLDNEDIVIPKKWQSIMIKIDSVDNATQLITNLYLKIKRCLIDWYKDFLNSTDPISDLPTIKIIKGIINEEEEHLEWAEKTISELSNLDSTESVLADIDISLANNDVFEQISLEKSLWQPLDRVPRVARPLNVQKGVPGALRIMPLDSLYNPKDIATFIHGFINEEYTTLELICRNIYEHPDMPWQFHMDMARHASDEARHAQILERLLLTFETRYGDLPIYISSYVGQYQFEPCERGSRKELLWRILLRQTFHEGLALDSLVFEIRKRNYVGQKEIARIFEFLLCDEVFHAESGLKWSRFLCDNDINKAMKEREIAHDYFFELVKLNRAKFVASNLEKAIDEVLHLEEMDKNYDLPFVRTININARKKAGFTEEELEQIIEWGYVEKS